MDDIQLANPPNVYPVTKYTWIIAGCLAAGMWFVVKLISKPASVKAKKGK